VLTVLPLGVAACGAASILLAALMWTRRRERAFDRISLTLVAAALALMALLMRSYGIMGQHLG